MVDWMRKDPRCGIYMIRNTANGKCYIGSTSNHVRRWKYHKYQLRNSRHPNAHLQRAWNKHTEEAFEFLWLEDVPEDSLLDKEQEWIDANEDGYNISTCPHAFARGLKWPEERKRRLSATQTGRKLSDETKKKISEAQTGKTRGPRTEEVKAKIRAGMTGKQNGLGYTHTPEARKKMSEVNIGNQNFLGKKHSDETKKKISDHHKGRKMSASQIEFLRKVHTGLKASPETRAKMSESHKRRNMELRANRAAESQLDTAAT